MAGARETWGSNPGSDLEKVEQAPVITNVQQPVGRPPSGPNFIERAVHSVWTGLCFAVFGGFCLMLGWHLRGWHFTAYYISSDAPPPVAPTIAARPIEGTP